jgi:hypothetical protein
MSNPVHVKSSVVDPKLKALLDMADQATDTFLEACKTMNDRLSFKAFTIGGALTKEQKNSLLDVIMTQIAIRLKAVAPHLMEEINITCSVESGDEDFVLWVHACNEKPDPVDSSEAPYSSFDPDENVVVPKIEPMRELRDDETVVGAVAIAPTTVSREEYLATRENIANQIMDIRASLEARE